ncbi:MAG: hypothetical protein K0S51_873 [Bacillales bacterium]|jgi:hypothetical protein|nr:hypothetical protein [Bacillales bacterium]
MNVYNLWIYKHVLNTVPFLWGFVSVIIAFNVFSLFLATIILREKKSPSKNGQAQN